MCSTFKMLLAAALLKRSDTGHENRSGRRHSYRPLLRNSPLAQEQAGSQMTLGELCRAVIVRSDNTAANFLLAAIGSGDYLTARVNISH
jgi:beta-lactamase class A